MRVPLNINLPAVRMKAGGEFRLMTYEPFYSYDRGLIVADDTDWFDNLVLDNALIQMTTKSTWANRFHIGSSSTPPSITDTALFAWMAVNNTSLSDQNTNLGSPNYQGQTTRGRRFNAGVGTGTIREIGITQETTNTNMSIRALVTPEITKAAPQILDAFYRYTCWPSLIDGTGIVNIFGDDYDYTVRMGAIQDLTRVFDQYVPDPSISRHTVYDGDIGPITGLPSGNSDNASSLTITSQGSGFCNYTVGFSVDNGNLPGGIRSIASRIVGGATAGEDPRIQVEFRNRGEGSGALDSTIPKNNTREISFDLGITWDRH